MAAALAEALSYAEPECGCAGTKARERSHWCCNTLLCCAFVAFTPVRGLDTDDVARTCVFRSCEQRTQKIGQLSATSKSHAGRL